MNQQLEESEQLIADFGKRNTELEEQLSVLRDQVQEKDGGANARAVNRPNFKLGWREGKKSPCDISRCCDAVVDKNTVYTLCILCIVWGTPYMPTTHIAPIGPQFWTAQFTMDFLSLLLMVY